MKSAKAAFYGIVLAWVFLISWAIYKDFDGSTIALFVALAVSTLTSTGILLNSAKSTTCTVKKKKSDRLK